MTSVVGRLIPNFYRMFSNEQPVYSVKPSWICFPLIAILPLLMFLGPVGMTSAWYGRSMKGSSLIKSRNIDLSISYSSDNFHCNYLSLRIIGNRLVSNKFFLSELQNINFDPKKEMKFMYKRKRHKERNMLTL